MTLETLTETSEMFAQYPAAVRNLPAAHAVRAMERIDAQRREAAGAAAWQRGAALLDQILAECGIKSEAPAPAPVVAPVVGKRTRAARMVEACKVEKDEITPEFIAARRAFVEFARRAV